MTHEPYLARSAIAPERSATVMMAKLTGTLQMQVQGFDVLQRQLLDQELMKARCDRGFR